ncbi:hypothetical protein [Levilactobacillus zymae]|uniref:hypothetical protein n=1 Tax=Levilactobacillus zymae TaxID=267363 RepID=UPI001265F6F4|nr:hypothetical protein [Levilactobacillus zymae]QFR60027.1 hypothetical protein LZ395_00040 [Levilactobacillus zymae]
MAELPQRLAYPLLARRTQRIAKKFGKSTPPKPEYQVYAGPFMVSSHGDTQHHWHMSPIPLLDRKRVLTRINVNVYRSQAQPARLPAGKLDEVRS